jgi:hypothetical protein
MNMQQDIQNAKLAILNAIKTKSINTSSSLKLVVDCMKIVEQAVSCKGKDKKNILLTCLQDIAKGADGLSGTADDVISKEIMNSLSILLNENVIEDVIEFVIDLSKGKFDVKLLQTVSKSTFKSCLVCLGKQPTV